MKKLIIICFALIMALAGVGCSGGAYVATQPDEVVYTRPAPPGDGYIWIDGDWYYSGGRYIHRNGYWTHPRPGRTWYAGSWQHSNRGYHWQRGRWQKH